jgi:hypothetical protein
MDLLKSILFTVSTSTPTFAATSGTATLLLELC